MVCQDEHACEQLYKQFCKARGLTYELTNHKRGYSNYSDFGLLLDSDVAKVAISSTSNIYGLKFSTVSTFFSVVSW